MDKVSIIIPAYNDEPYLDKCVESAENQTYENIEIFLINDGSTDGTLRIIRNWELKDSKRITGITQENKGVSVARNKGIDASTGKWIVFVDGDDYLEPDAVEKMVGAADDNTDLLITDFFVNKKEETVKSSFYSLCNTDFGEKDKIELIKNFFTKTSFANRKTPVMPGSPWAKLYNAETIRKNNIRFDETLRKMQDAMFNCEMVRCSKNIKYRSFSTYHYIQNPDSICHKCNPNYENIAEALLKSLHSFIERNGYEKELMPVYYAKEFMFAFESAKFIYVMDNSGMALDKKIKGTKRIMKKHSFKGHEKELLPYLSKQYKAAYILYKIGIWWLLYLAMWGYYHLH